MCTSGWPLHITTSLGAQAPGARTTRFCRTLITPVVCAMVSLTVARPEKPHRADVTSVHRRPARVVTIAIRPSSMGRVAATYMSFPNFGKVEYFCRQVLSHIWVFCPSDNARTLPARKCSREESNATSTPQPSGRCAVPVTLRQKGVGAHLFALFNHVLWNIWSGARLSTTVGPRRVA